MTLNHRVKDGVVEITDHAFYIPPEKSSPIMRRRRIVRAVYLALVALSIAAGAIVGIR